MKLLRLKPGHGEIVLAEGDVEIPEQERELIEAFRRELDAGMWAAVPTETPAAAARRSSCKSFAEVPRDAERVIFFPRAAGGAPRRRDERSWGSRSAPRRSCWSRCCGSSRGRGSRAALARQRAVGGAAGAGDRASRL